MLFYEAFAKALIEAGVDTLFGQMGDANMYMVDNYVHQKGGRFVPAANEFGSTLMALGYAERTGKVGVVSTTHGPAVTNCVTPLVEGVRDRVPMVLLAGDTNWGVRDHPQGIDQRELIIATGAGFIQVGAAKRIQKDLAVALRQAKVERRPVALNIPTEFNWEDIEDRSVPDQPALVQRFRPDPDALDRALGVLASARRPLVLMGNGVTAEGAPAVLQLAERIGAPVATTLRGKGHTRHEPWAVGICGTFSSAFGNETILASDCIIAFGASMNRFTMAEGSFSKGKAIIHCDNDPESMGYHTVATVGVVGDAGATAEAMLELIEGAELDPSDFRASIVAQHDPDGDPYGPYEDLSNDQTVDVRTALRRINAAVPSLRTVVVGAGRVMGQPFKLIDAYDPQRWIYTQGFGSIGLDGATAIGAAVGAPDEPTLYICGDGGFMSGTLQELHAAVRENLDIIVVVCNDGAYGAEHVHFRHRNMDPVLSTFPWPDLAPVAEAIGLQGVTVRNLDDLAVAERAIADRTGPLLIDVKLDPDHVPALL
jgi:thiamine pyrophosphate-dependent acetolactate synthase large subunit-like protein